MLHVSRTQAVNYRLAVNNLSRRLAAGSYVTAAYVGLQDTAPRDALVGMHARVKACEPSAWQDPRLIQTYSPRQAVYVLPADDFGVFTVGRLPRDPEAREALEELAEQIGSLIDAYSDRSVNPALRPSESRLVSNIYLSFPLLTGKEQPR